MKKFWIILLVLVVLILGGIFIVAQFKTNENFTQKSYISNEEISAIILNVEDREIEVSPSNDEYIHIDYYESEKEYYNITVNDNGELTFSIVYNKNWLDYIGRKPSINYRKINLLVPNNLLNSIQIQTTNETIKVNNIAVLESVTLNSNGGDVEFENLFAGKQINLTVKNGNITGSVVGGWDDFAISCTIKKGDSNLPENKPNGEKSLTVDCNNGDVNVDFLAN